MYFFKKEKVIISAEKNLLPIIALIKDVIEMTCLEVHFDKNLALERKI
jgi:hypothetical protein